MEVWKDVPGYEGLYEVSDYGNVRTLDVRCYHKNKKQTKNKDGHMRVWLSKNSKKKWSFVHRLVAKAFINNPKDKPVVNHLDGVPYNNHVSNLEWATRSENDLHAFRIGLRKPSCGGTSKPVVRVDIHGYEEVYKSITEAAKCNGFNSTGQLSHYIYNNRPYKDYTWKLLNEGVTTSRKT